MPLLDQESLSKLSMCHEDIQKIFYEAARTHSFTVHDVVKYPTNGGPALALEIIPAAVHSWSREQNFMYFSGYCMGIASKLFSDLKTGHLLYCDTDRHCSEQLSEQALCNIVRFWIIA